MVRATNNGVSAFVDDKGRLLEAGPQFEFVSMTRDIPPMSGMTPFARFGNWPLILVLLAAVGPFALKHAAPRSI
jgi:apolipoprotein N-acyltransferase